ncbi:MAG: hypothetical protein WCQ32_03535 [bacterium]
MLYSIFNAATVTANKIFFTCEEKRELNINFLDPFAEQNEVPVFKIRHHNRIQTSQSKKTAETIAQNKDRRYYRSLGEWEKRSKEKAIAQRHAA